MFIGSLNNQLPPMALLPSLTRIIADLANQTTYWHNAPPGRYNIAGNSIFALVSEEQTSLPDKRRGEYHQRYLDIQLLLRGEEWIGIDPHKGGAEAAEQVGEDLWLVHSAPSTYVALTPGDIAIFWPTELHRPLCTLTQPAMVKKVVIKVELTTLEHGEHKQPPTLAQTTKE